MFGRRKPDMVIPAQAGIQAALHEPSGVMPAQAAVQKSPLPAAGEDGLPTGKPGEGALGAATVRERPSWSADVSSAPGGKTEDGVQKPDTGGQKAEEREEKAEAALQKAETRDPIEPPAEGSGLSPKQNEPSQDGKAPKPESQRVLLGYRAVGVIVHRDSPVTELKLEELQDIYWGRLERWPWSDEESRGPKTEGGRQRADKRKFSYGRWLWGKDSAVWSAERQSYHADFVPPDGNPAARRGRGRLAKQVE